MRVRTTLMAGNGLTRPKLAGGAVLMVLALAACDPQQVADQAGRRVAASVVLPVVQIDLPTPLAQKATDCIVQNATAAEVQALARDVAVVAGSSTKATIRGIATRPEAAACFTANGVPQVRP
ncbi:MAG: hypothetical protein MUC82_05290 [Cypionkella sp.]|nr:hypothetical protein [Cypionkella sp.]